MPTDTRTTGYTAILYPDSCDIERAKLIIQHSHVRAMLSPLHDQDEYDAADVEDWKKRVENGNEDIEIHHNEVKEGARKKPHYHLILDYGRSKKSAKQVLDFVQTFAPSCRYVEPIRNMWGTKRYLVHMDDADKGKVLYSVEDVVCFGGIDDSPLYDTTKGAKRSAVPRICGYITEYGIYEWFDLVQVVLRLDDAALLDALVERTNFFVHFMDSLVHKIKTDQSAIGIDDIVDSIRGVKNEQFREVA